MKLLKAFTYLLLGAVVVIGGYSLIDKPYQQLYPAPSVGGTVLPASLGVFYMAGSGVTSSATSITLTKLQISTNDYNIQDGDLGDTMHLTLEPGSTSRQEQISCSTIGSNTGGNVTLSGCTRGLSAISPYTASSTQAFSHSGGSKVIFSNPASFYNQILFKGNNETITGTYTYTSTAIPIFDSNPTITDDKHFATKKYADDLAIAGSPDASLTVKGLTEIATQTGMASTSIAGSGDTTAWLSLTSAYSTSTPSGDSYSGLFVPVSENDGKLSQLWLDLTEAFTWTGAHIFSSTVDIAGLFTTTATSTMATTTIAELTVSGDTSTVNLTSTGTQTFNGIDWTFPASDGSASQILSTDGSKTLSFIDSPYYRFVASDTLVVSADTERYNNNSVTYTKKKEILVRTDGTIRIKFDLKCVDPSSAYGRIYINGAAVGTERNTAETTYQNYSEDIAVTAGDLVQLYLKNANTGASIYAYAQNFRFYYTKTKTDEYTVKTN